MARKEQDAMEHANQNWIETKRCAFCECPVYIHKDGYAITLVTGVEHLCGVNCECRYKEEK